METWRNTMARLRLVPEGGALLLLALIVAAYGSTLNVPFLFDDGASILDNPSIRRLTDWGAVLSPPAESGTGGRPLANLSLAVSHALSGGEPWGFHLLNLVCHFLAALCLADVVRRVLQLPSVAARLREQAPWVAWAVAGLWAVHPVQTQTVTYISQRTESLMALCYLLTIDCFLRAMAGRRFWWLSLSVVAAWAGALCKEVIVTVPVMVVLLDRTFVAGSFRAAWRARAGYYGALALTWVLLAWLLVGVDRRGVGLGLGVSGESYVRTQCQAVWVYLGLGIWPYPLIFDRGPLFLESWAAASPFALGLAAVLGAGAWAWWRWPAWGFLVAWFFVVLAPTSSVVPIIQSPIAENRVHLPLAAVVAALVIGLWLALGRRAAAGVCAGLVLLGVLATARRNRDYESAIAIWSDTVAKLPANYRAHNNLGQILARDPSRQAEALAHLEEAVRLKPDDADARNNLAILLADRPGRAAEAIQHFAVALAVRPERAATHNNLANLLARQPGRQAEARRHYEIALRLQPGQPEAHRNLAQLLAGEPGQENAAQEHYEQALRGRPGYVEARNDLAILLARQPGRQGEAIAQYEQVLREKPDFAEAHNNLAIVLAGQPGRSAEAIAHYETALRLRGNYPAAHRNLANLLGALPGRQDEAVSHYEAALRLQPDDAEAHNNLAVLLAARPSDRSRAIAHYEAALRLNPKLAEAHNNLGLLLGADSSRRAEAIAHFESASRLLPRSAVVHFNLARELEKAPEARAEAMRHYAAAREVDPGFAPAADALRRLQGVSR